jgi:imidazolonepropionase-like amidohydrolase
MRISHRPVQQQVAAACDEAADCTVIQADLLIPGRGDPIHNGALVICEDKIEWVGPHNALPSEYHSVRPIQVPTVMPGLWDCHVHFTGIDVVGGLSSGTIGYLPGTNALTGAVTVDDLRATLMAGYTTVRELGGFGGDVWPAVKMGAIVGPNVYSSIAALSITGGHGDNHDVPLDTVLDWGKGGGQVGICDGPVECTKMVRRLVRRGARCIKVCSSGGVLSLLDDPEDRQFSDEELKAIVDEASRSRRSVAAHAIGKEGILAAIRAGVKSIEHGMYIDKEVADIMVEKDIIFVPTHHIVETLAADPSHLPLPLQRKVLKLHQKSRDSYRIAIKQGVKIALGTDTLSSDRKKPLSHGNNARELYWAVQMGMTPLQAIEAGTANAPETLGGHAPLSGQLKAGYDADIIAISTNPLDDIEVLNKQQNITHVWKGGKLFKSPQ